MQKSDFENGQFSRRLEFWKQWRNGTEGLHVSVLFLFLLLSSSFLPILLFLLFQLFLSFSSPSYRSNFIFHSSFPLYFSFFSSPSPFKSISYFSTCYTISSHFPRKTVRPGSCRARGPLLQPTRQTLGSEPHRELHVGLFLRMRFFSC